MALWWWTHAALTMAAPEAVVFEVAAGAQDRAAVPLTAPLPTGMEESTSLWMQRLDTGATVPVQRVDGDPPAVIWMLDGRLPARQSRRYRLSASSVPRTDRPPVLCLDTGRALSVKVRGKSVLTYHTAVVEPPAGADRAYRRSGFIHPLQTPGGRVVTDDFPADHLHQHGVFLAWVNAEFEGHDVDFWNQAKGLGTVAHQEVLWMVNGPVFAEFAVRLTHQDLTRPARPAKVLEEDWLVRVYDRDDVFLIDLESRQRCATDQPLQLREYHYGGLAFRGSSQWLGQPESNFLTSEGKSRDDGNHTRPRWTDCFGRVDGDVCGVAVLQHPQNFRYPQPVRLHPEKPYFVYSPMVDGAFSIEPGREYHSRYRYVVHDARPDAHLLDAAWSAYAEPPEVRILD
jgi:hypothetical protein